jgi:hypothetical protein
MNALRGIALEKLLLIVAAMAKNPISVTTISSAGSSAALLVHPGFIEALAAVLSIPAGDTIADAEAANKTLLLLTLKATLEQATLFKICLANLSDIIDSMKFPDGDEGSGYAESIANVFAVVVGDQPPDDSTVELIDKTVREALLDLTGQTESEVAN